MTWLIHTLPGKLATALFGAIIGLAALGIGFVNAAGNHHTTNCVNSILGTRQDPTARDSEANQEIANALNDLTTSLNVALAAPEAEQAAAFAAFAKVSEDVQTRTKAARDILAADAAFREAHPLGRC